jgi:hypothetical protein
LRGWVGSWGELLFYLLFRAVFFFIPFVLFYDMLGYHRYKEYPMIKNILFLCCLSLLLTVTACGNANETESGKTETLSVSEIPEAEPVAEPQTE